MHCKILNFDNFFIWICWGSKILILKSDEHKMGRTSISNGHKCLMDWVFMVWTREAWGHGFEVMGSSAGDREACIWLLCGSLLALLQIQTSLSASSLPDLWEPAMIYLHCRFWAWNWENDWGWNKTGSEGSHHCRFMACTGSELTATYHCRF